MSRSNDFAMTAVLCVVVAASLLLLLFGLNDTPGVVEVLQLPTTLAQILFTFAVVRRFGLRDISDRLTRVQRGLILALVIYVAAISIIAQEPSSALFSPVWMVHLVFFAAVVAFFHQAADESGKTVWMVFGITGLLHVVVFFVAWIIWPDKIRAGVLPAFDNIRHLGYFLAPAAAAMAVIFATRRDRPALPLLCFVAAAFYLIYSGSRGGSVALVAGLIVIGAFWLWHRHAFLFSRLLILLVVTVAMILISEVLPHLPWKPLFGRGVDALEQTGTEMLGGRSQVWAAAWHAIGQNWLWGYGPAIMGRLAEYQGPTYRHPHNIGLQLLLHWGLAGTLLTLATVCAFLPNLWVAMRKAPERALVPLTVLATMCIHALVDGGLYYPYSTVIAIIAFAQLQGIGWQARQGRATTAD